MCVNLNGLQSLGGFCAVLEISLFSLFVNFDLSMNEYCSVRDGIATCLKEQN